MSRWLTEVQLGVRQLRTHSGHSAVVIVTLGLALGLSAVIFSFVNFFVLRPLPIKDEKTMVLARSAHPQASARPRISYPDFVDFKAQAQTVEELVAVSTSTGALTGAGDARRVTVAAATEGLFRVWDLEVQQGRRFLAAEDAEGASPVLLLSHGFWEREFGRDRTVVGKTLILNGRASIVVGVLSPAIEIGNLSEIDLWMPLTQASPSLDRERRDLMVSGRRKPGITTDQVSAEFSTIAARLEKEHPDTNRDWTANVIPFRDGVYGSGTTVILALLVVGVILVFAVACANVAGMMLARATTREREIALRLSLGAERGQIARQLVIEGAVLSAFACLLGLGLAKLSLDLIRTVGFEQFYDLVTIDWRVLGFAVALTLIAPLLFGLAPAWQQAGRQLSAVLRDSGTGAGTSGRVGRGRRGLVVMQISLATALLIVSGLAVRTAISLSRFDYGFDTTDLLSVRLDLNEARYATPDQISLQVNRLVEAVSGLPQTRGVSVGSERPVFDSPRQMAFQREGRSNDDAGIAMVTRATPGYFETLGIQLRQGREFVRSDSASAAAVAVVNEALVARDFGGVDPRGKRIRVGDGDAAWLEVVGVCSNIAGLNLQATPAPQVYVAFDQTPHRSVVLFVRTTDPAAVLAFLRETMRTLDPDQPLYDARTMEQVVWEELAGNRVITGLFAALGAVALALAAVGLYGLTAFLVAQRSREIGVRMALGASVRDVLGLVISQGARLTAAGLSLGLLLGLALGRAMSGLLVGVNSWDPLTLAGTLGVLGVSAVLAHLVPARRAARVNPIDALRHD